MHGGAIPAVKAKALKRYNDAIADMIDPDRAIREAARLAYSSIGDLITPEGHIKPPKDWPEWAMAAVSSYKTEVKRGNIDKGDGAYDDIVKTELKLWDKPRNVELLFKHLGMLIERSEVTIKNLDGRLREARRRVG